MTTQLADIFMPIYDVREYHESQVVASPDVAYSAFRSVDLSRSFAVRLLFAIRTLPSRLRGESAGVPRGPFLEQVLKLGWIILKEVPGQALIAGAVTQPWEPVVRFRGVPADEFTSFNEPGFAKIIWGIAARPTEPDRSVISTETRVQTTDEASRRKFRRYWFVFGIGIRLIRRAALRIVKHDLARRRSQSQGK